ncbi:hypothetical protein ACOMCU_24545 [Lysinibacillus sp. UGB7]|uniref:DUF7832 domain-containing protein n=1 Tax=Lysinibacillus sp. UGB7 TaxID=3411039 RepID=UPI003B7BCC18
MAYDKAKWHFDAEDFPSNLAITQGGVHIAFFYRWMLENDFASDELFEDAKEEKNLIKAGQYSVLNFLFEFLDGVLLDEDLNDSGADFANHYYEDKNNFGHYLSDYSHLDFEHLPDMDDRLYGVMYSEANYKKVKEVMDRRYKEFLTWKIT